jgi:hypothetical protein
MLDDVGSQFAEYCNRTVDIGTAVTFGAQERSHRVAHAHGVDCIIGTESPFD